MEPERYCFDDEIGLSRKRIVNVFLWVRRAVVLCLGAMLVAWMVSLIAFGLEFVKAPSDFLPIMSYVILHGAILIALAIVTIAAISHAIKEQTSFSRYRVKMMALALVLLVSLFLVECLMPIEGSYELLGGAICVDINDPAKNPLINVNPGVILFLLVIISVIIDYRYGMLLQQLEDETV